MEKLQIVKTSDFEDVVEHFQEYKILYILGVAFIIFITSIIWYEYNYPCVKGHYEEQWQTTYCNDVNGNMYPCGGYFANVFICDCRTVRDSIKH